MDAAVDAEAVEDECGAYGLFRERVETDSLLADPSPELWTR